jgi:CRISPR-associated endonuclease/helicase Cas3
VLLPNNWHKLLAFWGKSYTHDGELFAYPIVAHSLDVAAAGSRLPVPLTEFDKRTVCFLLSLHDIGKFSRPFQAQESDLWPSRVLGPWPGRVAGPRHDALTAALLEAFADEGLLDPVFPPGRRGSGWHPSKRFGLIRTIAGHHGRPIDVPDHLEPAVCRLCLDAAREFVQVMLDLFQPSPLPPPQSRRASARMQWQIAGFLTLADWIGSNETWFPRDGTYSDLDPHDYFREVALPRATQACEDAGLPPSKARTFTGFSALFPKVDTPSPAQSWAETVPLPEGAVLAIIEDLTGSGKTEAALTLASRIMASGEARGIFFALPSMATANSMFQRLTDTYLRLFEEGSRPSIALTHGKASLDPRFRELISASPSWASEPREGEAIPSEAECAAWLAEDRRRSLFADVGIGTIDQALLAVLPVRHAPLRLHGLQGKVLVVDEVHAFDSYMERELQALLEFHAALGGSAILLSATLPLRMRQSLTDAFRRGAGQETPRQVTSTHYPLATIVGSEAQTEYPLGVRTGLPRSVTITRIDTKVDALSRVVDAARLGAAVVWIRNSVDDALEAAAAVRMENIDPIVFHARFAHIDRQSVEQEVLRRFGKDSIGHARAGVLIATQVVEQSLDLDFDLLVTDLAPVDSLIQRAGRLWRHSRGPRVLGRPEMVVLSPAPSMESGPCWLDSLLPRTNAVYQNPALLWRGALALFAKSDLVTPGDMRPLIEAADNVEDTPLGLKMAADGAWARHLSHRAFAAGAVLDFDEGYTLQSGAWDRETRTPTRLEEREQVTLRLARVKDGKVVPYAGLTGDLRQAWTLSEVRVQRYRIAACPPPAGYSEAAEDARSQWGRWERESPHILLAILEVTKQEGRFMLQGENPDGHPVSAVYDATDGLRWLPASAG